MARRTTGASTRGAKAIRVPVPATRDPFVNTPLIALGPGADGRERFWISTWNANVGTTAVLVDEDRGYRVFRFPPECPGFYSAAPESADVLWLCGWLDKVVRLDLRTGKWEISDTGAPRALVFQGMVFDPATRKLFAAAFPYPEITAFSFDTVARKTVKLHAGFTTAHYMRFSFPNGDGTWSITMQTPGASLLRWGPRTEALSSVDFPAAASGCRFIGDDEGRRYFPGHGWYDPRTGKLDDAGPRPRGEAAWVARFGDKAYGMGSQGEFVEWDMKTGATRRFGSGIVPDGDTLGVNFTRSGKAIAVNLYGNLYIVDAASGALELAKILPTDAVGRVDCLLRIDKERLLGTPFITQRFWEATVRTGAGADMGRAAPGGGEVLQTWLIRGKVYMAAYTGADLVEYDPAKPARFPENPHLVAKAPEGMRPVAAADDGRFIYYAASARYGCFGSTLAKYDTRTGLASYAANPVLNHQIVSLRYDRPTKRLVCGTTYNADCCSAPACEPNALFARVDPADLSVESTFPAPADFASANVAGPLGRGRYLCALQQDIPLLGGSDASDYFVLDLADFRAPAPAELRRFPAKLSALLPTRKPGLFVLEMNGSIELWDMRKPARVRTLVHKFAGYRWTLDRDSLYLMYPKEIVIQPLGL